MITKSPNMAYRLNVSCHPPNSFVGPLLSTYHCELVILASGPIRSDYRKKNDNVLNETGIWLILPMQVWFKNRRAKFRKKQRALKVKDADKDKMKESTEGTAASTSKEAGTTDGHIDTAGWLINTFSFHHESSDFCHPWFWNKMFQLILRRMDFGLCCLEQIALNIWGDILKERLV